MGPTIKILLRERQNDTDTLHILRHNSREYMVLSINNIIIVFVLFSKGGAPFAEGG